MRPQSLIRHVRNCHESNFHRALSAWHASGVNERALSALPQIAEFSARHFVSFPIPQQVLSLPGTRLRRKPRRRIKRGPLDKKIKLKASSCRGR
jgi:hypothetical protein